jgi:phosphoribosylanthranilate isomerase
MQLLKTCWIREELQNYNNIDLLWFNFVESSKRYITPEKASEIETPFSTLRVWVFWILDENKKWKNITKNELVDIILTAKKSRMNAVQIHWNCDFTYLKLYNYLVFSSVNIEQDINFNNENIDFYIIDWANPGSWEWYDYFKINELNLEKNFLVAGWISENNVWEIFEIFKENKYFCGVDIASWVDNWKNIDLEKIGKIVEKME